MATYLVFIFIPEAEQCYRLRIVPLSNSLSLSCVAGLFTVTLDRQSERRTTNMYEFACVDVHKVNALPIRACCRCNSGMGNKKRPSAFKILNDLSTVK